MKREENTFQGRLISPYLDGLEHYFGCHFQITAILRHTRTVANFSVATSWFLVDVNQNRCHNDTRLRFLPNSGLQDKMSNQNHFQRFLTDFAMGTNTLGLESQELEDSQDDYEYIQSSQIRFPDTEETQVMDDENESVSLFTRALSYNKQILLYERFIISFFVKA